MNRELEQNKPSFLERLTRGNLPLVKQEGEIYADDPFVRQALELIWLVAKFFTEHCVGSSVTLSAPASLLVEMGLVSQRTAEAIQGQVARKREEGGSEEDVFNQIEIVNIGDGFELRESYKTEEIFNGGNRLDRMVKERAKIRRTPNGGFSVEIVRLSAGEHLHALGKIWVEKDEKPPEVSRDKAMLLTGRWINTTLAVFSGWYERWQKTR